MTTHYVELSDPIYDTVTKRVRKTYPTACIVYIERIENEQLEAAFAKRKASLEALRGADAILIRQLFHGTTEKAVDSIVRNGFDPAYNTVSAYGIGTYFSPSSQVSKDYAKSKKEELNYMFLADVLVGLVGRAPASAPIDTKIMDTSINNGTIDNSTIICTPYADGAIPRYIIAFYRYAT